MKLKLKKTIVALAFAAIAPLSTAFADAPSVIRIGIPGTGEGGRPITGGSFGSYALNQGLLEDEFKQDGIQIKVSYFAAAGPAVNESFANGLLDFAYLGDQAAIVGKSGGLDYRLVLAGSRNQNFAIAVPPESNIKTVEDLRGKRVAIFRGTALQLGADRILEAHGLSEKDVKVVNINGLAQQAALASKDVDAVITQSAAVINYQRQGIGKGIYNSKDDPKLKIDLLGAYVVSEKWAKKYPEITQRIINVLVKAAARVSNEKNRTEVFQNWAKSGTAFSTWKEDYNGRTLKGVSSPVLDEEFLGKYQKAIDDLKKFKLIRRDVDLKSWIDNSYAEKALRDQKLENFWSAK